MARTPRTRSGSYLNPDFLAGRTTGPYRFVRHPGYLGFFLIILAQPLMLGSLWALVPAVFTAALFVVRTGREDDTLPTELSGYREYAQGVRYRLIPGIW
jgi:protein-S-isoprenylcysteine O-methyltransferase Ste14